MILRLARLNSWCASTLFRARRHHLYGRWFRAFCLALVVAAISAPLYVLLLFMDAAMAGRDETR
jgi:hypothetical protein